MKHNLFTFAFLFFLNFSNFLIAFDSEILSYLTKHVKLEEESSLKVDLESEEVQLNLLFDFYAYDQLDFSLSNDLAIYWKTRYLTLSTFDKFCSHSNFTPEENNLNALDFENLQKSNYNYKKPQDYNLKIIINDKINLKEDYQSYAKIYIDRRYVGESERGLRSQKKEFTFSVSYNKSILIEVEKYVFNPLKSQWERLLNLYQPKKRYVKVEGDRILVVHMEYDSSKENPEENNLKYKYLEYYLIED